MKVYRDGNGRLLCGVGGVLRVFVNAGDKPPCLYSAVEGLVGFVDATACAHVGDVGVGFDFKGGYLVDCEEAHHKYRTTTLDEILQRFAEQQGTGG